MAVSGIVGGRALKGPADRMLRSLGSEASALGVARQYTGIADVFVLDQLDAGQAPAIEALAMRAVVTDTVMTDDAARARLANNVVSRRTKPMYVAENSLRHALPEANESRREAIIARLATERRRKRRHFDRVKASMRFSCLVRAINNALGGG